MKKETLDKIIQLRKEKLRLMIRIDKLNEQIELIDKHLFNLLT